MGGVGPIAEGDLLKGSQGVCTLASGPRAVKLLFMVRFISTTNRRLLTMTGIGVLLGFALPAALESVTSYVAAPGYRVDAVGTEAHTAGPVGNLEAEPVWEERAIDSGGRAMVHSATLIELADGGIRAFWFGGTREGARDVGIYTAHLPPNEQQWGAAREIMDREKLSEELGRYIKKLGNPVGFLDAAGQVWVFFVSVSFGGWSGSAINAMVSRDGGATFGPARRLVSSPAFNVSTLVRGRPIQRLDGSIALPVYHEFLGKFAELLHLNPDGSVQGKRRLTRGRSHIQPTLVAVDAETAHVFMRYAGKRVRRVHYVSTSDAGLSFTSPRHSNLPNPDSAIDAIRLASGETLMVYNHSETGRNNLSLAVSGRDPAEWTRIYDIERSETGSGQHFSYPSILQDSSGRFHVAYTYNRRYIKHVTFNETWLAQTRRGPATEP
jgi:predicted neuraminidase